MADNETSILLSYLESIQADVREIKTSVSNVEKVTAAHESRISVLEDKGPKSGMWGAAGTLLGAALVSIAAAFGFKIDL